MFPPLNIGRAILSFSVSDGDIHNLHALSRRSQEEIEIAKRIYFTEVTSVLRNDIVFPLPDDLRPAERVFDGLTQNP